MPPEWTIRHYPPFPVVIPVSRGRLVTCYSPFRRFTRLDGFRARLACLIHTANVRSEPGSNPSLEVFDLGLGESTSSRLAPCCTLARTVSRATLVFKEPSPARPPAKCPPGAPPGGSGVRFPRAARSRALRPVSGHVVRGGDDRRLRPPSSIAQKSGAAIRRLKPFHYKDLRIRRSLPQRPRGAPARPGQATPGGSRRARRPRFRAAALRPSRTAPAAPARSGPDDHDLCRVARQDLEELLDVGVAHADAAHLTRPPMLSGSFVPWKPSEVVSPWSCHASQRVPSGFSGSPKGTGERPAGTIGSLAFRRRRSSLTWLVASLPTPTSHGDDLIGVQVDDPARTQIDQHARRAVGCAACPSGGSRSRPVARWPARSAAEQVGVRGQRALADRSQTVAGRSHLAAKRREGANGGRAARRGAAVQRARLAVGGPGSGPRPGAGSDHAAQPGPASGLRGRRAREPRPGPGALHRRPSWRAKQRRRGPLSDRGRA